MGSIRTPETSGLGHRKGVRESYQYVIAMQRHSDPLLSSQHYERLRQDNLEFECNSGNTEI